MIANTAAIPLTGIGMMTKRADRITRNRVIRMSPHFVALGSTARGQDRSL